MFSWLLIGGFLKIFDRVCDTFEAIDAAQFTIHTLVTEPVTNGRACFDRLEPDALGGQFIGHAGKSVSALQVKRGAAERSSTTNFGGVGSACTRFRIDSQTWSTLKY